MDDPIGVSFYFRVKFFVQCRAVGRSENPGVPVLFGGHNLSPLVDIGLTVLPKSGGAMAPPPRHPQGRQACSAVRHKVHKLFCIVSRIEEVIWDENDSYKLWL